MTGESIRVLHVDDEPGLADLAAEFLERADDRFAVVTATDPERACDRLAQRRFDCVVSDYDMPGMDGLEFLESVRADHSDLPFILFTGKGSEEVASEAISAGVTDYLQKGSGTERYELLANRIRNAVAARRSATEADRRRHRLEQILKTVPAGVVQLDAEGNFEFANERAAEILDIERPDLTDRTYDDAAWDIRDLDGDPIPDAELPFRRVRDTGDPIRDARHTVETPDGSRKVLSVNGAPLVDDAGTVESVVFALTDITARRRRERELEATSNRLTALFEHSPDMISVHDATGTIRSVNPRLCTATGYDAATLEGMKIWELDDAVGRDRAEAIWAEMDAGDQHRIESAYRRHDGSTLPVEVHLARLEHRNDDLFVAIARDISEQQAYREELERQNERLAEFASVVSHDLRNPLEVARGRLALALPDDGPGANSNVAVDTEHLAAVDRALERMDSLLEDFLTLAQTGRTVETTEPVELARAVEACWANVATGDASVTVATERTIDADRGRLQRLLENLLRNAVDHGGDDVTVTVGDLSDRAGFYVADDGPGIPPDEREQVFEFGYTTADAGTGFGLSIVAEIADAHGWSVEITDGPAGGARFEIRDVTTFG